MNVNYWDMVQPAAQQTLNLLILVRIQGSHLAQCGYN